MAFTSGYDNSEAQVCMTLATIAYSSENVPSQIQATIQTNLANTNFATAGNWELVWLGVADNNQNLIYVAQNTTQPAQYAIAIRGTDWCFPVNFKEDFTVTSQSAPGFGPSDLLVSNGALDGLNEINSVTSAPIAGGSAVTFLQYLQNQYAAGGFDSFDVYVTGHSLGGCLASITFPWLVETWNGATSLNVKAYTFAAPTAGNAAFASYATSLSASGPYYYWAVANPRDLAPQAWSNLANVIPQGIVVSVTFKLALELIFLISAFLTKLQNAGVSYAQPGAANTYSPTNDLDFSPSCGTPRVSTMTDYFCWVGSEHAGDTYLTLLGATPTGITNVMNCPPPSSAGLEGSPSPVAQQQIDQWKQNNPGQE